MRQVTIHPPTRSFWLPPDYSRSGHLLPTVLTVHNLERTREYQSQRASPSACHVLHGQKGGVSSLCLLFARWVSVSPVVVSAIFVFPSHKKNVYMFSKLYCYFVWERKFLAVCRVGLMTHREYRVDCPFPVTWLDNV